MDPATIALISAAVQAAAKAAEGAISGQNAKKQAKLKAKETERETQADLLHNSLQRDSELTAHQLAGRGKLAKRKAQSMNDTSEIVRGALSI